MNFDLGFTASDLKRVVWTFVFTFLGVYWAAATGVSFLPNLSQAKALIVATFPSAVATAFSAAKNAALSDASRLK